MIACLKNEDALSLLLRRKPTKWANPCLNNCDTLVHHGVVVGVEADSSDRTHEPFIQKAKQPDRPVAIKSREGGQAACRCHGPNQFAATTHQQASSSMTDKPPLDRWRFDAIATGTEKIWGLEAIARSIGLSVATVKRYAARPDVPIYKPGGRYFALRSELNEWLRSK